MHAEYMDHLGSDLLVVNAAKVSFAKESKYEYNFCDIGDFSYEYATDLAKDGWSAYELTGIHVYLRRLKPPDIKLINYLVRGVPSDEWEAFIKELSVSDNPVQIEDAVTTMIDTAKHWAPFSHPHITLRMNAPVPIRTQAFKTKVGMAESEESRRYINSVPVLYVPNEFREAAENKKQGSGGKHRNSDYWRDLYAVVGKECINHYVAMLADGVAPEQARFILPQGVEVNWVWTGSLAAYARFYNQRTDSQAQLEVSMLADAVGKIIAPLYPYSWAALTRQEPVLVDEESFKDT